MQRKISHICSVQSDNCFSGKRYKKFMDKHGGEEESATAKTAAKRVHTNDGTSAQKLKKKAKMAVQVEEADNHIGN